MKVYQEEEGSTTTHDGKLYDLNKIFQVAARKSTIDISVDKLAWMVEETDLNYEGFVKRVREADISVPIIIIRWKGKYVTLDGFHRVCKALFIGEKSIKAILLEEHEIFPAIIRN